MDGWLGWGATFAVGLGAKMALNAVLPGASAAVDFAQAACDLSQGNIVGAAINIVSGVGDIATCGAVGSVKEAVEESAKAAAMQAEKAARRKVGQEFAKRLATGMVQGSKEAAIQSAKQTAKAAGKEATKEVGQQLSKEFAKGVVNALL